MQLVLKKVQLRMMYPASRLTMIPSVTESSQMMILSAAALQEKATSTRIMMPLAAVLLMITEKYNKSN